MSPSPASTLPEDKRVKLDGIVQQMTANNEPDENIHAVIADFKSKYGSSAPPVPNYGMAPMPAGRVSSKTADTDSAQWSGPLKFMEAAALPSLAQGMIAAPVGMATGLVSGELARRGTAAMGAPPWVQYGADLAAGLLGGGYSSRLGKLMNLVSPAEEGAAISAKYGMKGRPIAQILKGHGLADENRAATVPVSVGEVGPSGLIPPGANIPTPTPVFEPAAPDVEALKATRMARKEAQAGLIRKPASPATVSAGPPEDVDFLNQISIGQAGKKFANLTPQGQAAVRDIATKIKAQGPPQSPLQAPSTSPPSPAAVPQPTAASPVEDLRPPGALVPHDPNVPTELRDMYYTKAPTVGEDPIAQRSGANGAKLAWNKDQKVARHLLDNSKTPEDVMSMSDKELEGYIRAADPKHAPLNAEGSAHGRKSIYVRPYLTAVMQYLMGQR